MGPTRSHSKIKQAHGLGKNQGRIKYCYHLLRSWRWTPFDLLLREPRKATEEGNPNVAYHVWNHVVILFNTFRKIPCTIPVHCTIVFRQIEQPSGLLAKTLWPLIEFCLVCLKQLPTFVRSTVLSWRRLLSLADFIWV